MVCTGDLDHALGEVDARDTSAPVMELLGQIPGATACVEYREPVDVACELPQNGVGIQDTVAIPVLTHLYLPVISNTVPEFAGFFRLAVAHNPVSCQNALSIFDQNSRLSHHLISHLVYTVEPDTQGLSSTAVPGGSLVASQSLGPRGGRCGPRHDPSRYVRITL